MKTYEISQDDLITLASLKCGMVIVSGDHSLHCDARKLDNRECCNSCCARRIAEKYLNKEKD